MYLYRIKPDDSALRRWELGDAPLTMGRDEGATVRIPDYRMSGRHFTIAREDGAFVLYDLNSTNGTWVNGQRVTRRTLKPGDHIRAGRTLFSFETGLATVLRELEMGEVVAS